MTAQAKDFDSLIRSGQMWFAEQGSFARVKNNTLNIGSKAGDTFAKNELVKNISVKNTAQAQKNGELITPKANQEQLNWRQQLNLQGVNLQEADLQEAKKIECEQFDLEKINSGCSSQMENFSFGANEKVLRPFNIPEIDTALPNGGFLKGSINEWYAKGKDFSASLSINTVLACNLFFQQESAFERKVIWIGPQKNWPAPFILRQAMLANYNNSRKKNSLPFNALTLDRLAFDPLAFHLFIDPSSEREFLWALDVSLRSPAAAVVVASGFSATKKIKPGFIRKLSLGAAESGCIGLFMREPLSQPELLFFNTRWNVRPEVSDSGFPRYQLELARAKGTQPQKNLFTVELFEESTYEQNTTQNILLRVPPQLAIRSNVSPNEPRENSFARSSPAVGSSEFESTEFKSAGFKSNASAASECIPTEFITTEVVPAEFAESFGSAEHAAAQFSKKGLSKQTRKQA